MTDGRVEAVSGGLLGRYAARMRIVSLVPSLTELVVSFGLEDQLVGRTRFCTEPPRITGRVPALGGTKDPQMAAIVALRPDLVVANKEENRQEDVEALQAAGLEVLLTDPNSVADALGMIANLGALLGRKQIAGEMIAEVHAALGAALLRRGPRLRVAVAVWNRPLLVLGGESYGSDVLARCGLDNVFAGRPRYPAATLDELAAAAPQLILLPDEPFLFTERHAPRFRTLAPVRLIDGKHLWWYGPRMPAAIRYLRGIASGLEMQRRGA